MKKIHLSAIALILMFGATALQAQFVADASQDSLQEQIWMLQADLEDLKAELDAIKNLPAIQQLLAQERQRQAQAELDRQPLEVLVDVSEEPFKGEADAQIAVVEFSDFQCPACAAYTSRVAPQFNQDFVETGKVKFVFMDFPLQRHAQAFGAAKAAQCAAEQDAFWDMHDRLFADQSKLMPDDLRAHAEELGLDMEAFQTCFEGNANEDEIREDMQIANQVRLRGTPHFAIGYVEGDQVRVVRAMSGASYQKLAQTVNELLEAE